MTGELTVPLVTIGGATFNNMVVGVGHIVSGPSGAIPNGSEDAYDTASDQLTVPTVTVGNTTYHNVVATVASVVSIGTGFGMDAYDGTTLDISYVQAGGTVYYSVAITIGRVISVGTGMPTFARDVYDPASNHLTIAAVQFGSNVYTNVVVTAGTIASVGGISPAVTPTPLSTDFKCYGVCFNPKTLHVINTSMATVNISSITVTGPSAGGHPVFTETNNCPLSLGVAQSCAVAVSFGSPNVPARYQGRLVCADDAAGSPQIADLFGWML